MTVQDLDRSSFMDYISQQALKQPRSYSLTKQRDSNTPSISPERIIVNTKMSDQNINLKSNGINNKPTNFNLS